MGIYWVALPQRDLVHLERYIINLTITNLFITAILTKLARPTHCAALHTNLNLLSSYPSMLACDILISNSTPSVIVYTSCNNHARHFFTPDNHKVNMNNSVSKCTFLTVYVCLLFSTATVNGTICLLESNGNCTRHPGPATKTSTGAVYAVRKATAQGKFIFSLIDSWGSNEGP